MCIYSRTLLSILFSRQSLSLVVELVDWLTGWPADFRDPPASAVLGLEMCTTVPDIFVGAEDPHLGYF